MQDSKQTKAHLNSPLENSLNMATLLTYYGLLTKSSHFARAPEQHK